jgi:hypothetical protein
MVEIGESVKAETSEDNLYACCAYKDGKGGILITYFNTEDNLPNLETTLDLSFEGSGAYRLKYYLTDGDKTNELIKEETVQGTNIKLFLNIKEFDCYYIEIEKI